MKLVFYSGGNSRANRSLAREALHLLHPRRNPSIAFVPADADYADEDFREFCRSFSHAGITKLSCISIDANFTKEREKELFQNDAIFLGGGNTFYFLQHLRKQKLLPKLRAFAKNGGLLMGLSAGSILMTPNIGTAIVPTLEADENEVGIKDFRALSLVPFEFVAHYDGGKKTDKELLEYSKGVKYPVYACADGQGIVVKGSSLQFVGNIAVFHSGKKFLLQ